METVRLGYVGCGFVAQTIHIPNLSALPNARLEAIAEVRPKLRGLVAAKYGIKKQYDAHKQLCEDKEIDAVGVSAPFETQAEIACDLLRAGKHVFMEKPMAVSVVQGEKMLAAAKQGKARLMVAYMKRYDSGNELVKKAVDEFRRTGELGPVTFIRTHGFCGQQWTAGNSASIFSTDEKPPAGPGGSNLPDWLPTKNADGYLNYLQQYTHNLNLMRWLMDAGDVKVRAVDFDAENGYQGVAILEVGGVRAVIESGSMSHWGWDEHTQVYFRDGWVRTEAPPLLLKNVAASAEIYKAGKTQQITQALPADPNERWSWSYQREAAHFVAQVRSGAPFRSSGEDTLFDVRAFETIYRAYLGIK
ncbi:MAG: Gfo/Idh/MocA family oxidoreductase [Planctomycetes bacterium]|nr:Gfo/Idh/MocA family oxidoreductase [Planctomycetota bacterium]